LRWGLDRADEEGVEAYTEASQLGSQLYKKHGFEKHDEIVTKDGEILDLCMVRPSRTAVTVGNDKELPRN
jgi:hypothetical protein